jgi:hypothetical protein
MRAARGPATRSLGPMHDDDSAEDLDRELEQLLAERRAANPRRTPDREPLGTPVTRRLLALTATAIALATLTLLAVLVAG